MPHQIECLPPDRRGAPEGPRLPRRQTLQAHVRGAALQLSSAMGVLIAVERGRAGLTQAELAGRIGVVPTALSRFENGIPGAVTAAEARRILTELKLEGLEVLLP